MRGRSHATRLPPRGGPQSHIGGTSHGEGTTSIVNSVCSRTPNSSARRISIPSRGVVETPSSKPVPCGNGLSWLSGSRPNTSRGVRHRARGGNIAQLAQRIKPWATLENDRDLGGGRGACPDQQPARHVVFCRFGVLRASNWSSRSAPGMPALSSRVRSRSALSSMPSSSAVLVSHIQIRKMTRPASVP